MAIIAERMKHGPSLLVALDSKMFHFRTLESCSCNSAASFIEVGFDTWWMFRILLIID